jgi:hypothetical protein
MKIEEAAKAAVSVSPKARQVSRYHSVSNVTSLLSSPFTTSKRGIYIPTYNLQPTTYNLLII